jgi:hypothetical protein
MSGASEATLQELLEVNKSMANAIRGLASKSGGGAGGSGGGGTAATGTAGKAMNDLAKGASQVGAVLGTTVNVALGAFGVALNIATAGFNAFKKVGDQVIASQRQLANEAIDGASNLASFADSLKNLPFGLGLVAEAVAYQQKVTLKNLTTFQDLSKSGVNLGGSLTTVRESAKGMGLSMDEFANVMKANAGQFGRIGGTAEEGAKNMINFNKSFVKGETGRELGNLGLTAVELNNALGNYSEISGGISEAQLKDQKSLEASIKNYNEQLLMTAELTGKNREEMEKEMKERAKNAARDLMLSKMSAEEKKKYLAAEQAALAIGGKGAADALLSVSLGLPPMTKEARTFAAVNGKANQEVMKLNAATKDRTLSDKQFSDQLDKSTARGQKATADMVKGYGQTANALAFSSGAVADTIKDSMHQTATANSQGLKSEKDYEDRVKKTREGILKAEKEGTAGAANQANMAAKYQGEIMESIYAALAELWPIVLDVVKGFTSLVIAGIPLIKKLVGFIGNLYTDVLKPAFMALFGGIDIDDIVAPFKKLFAGLFGEDGADLKGVGNAVSGFLGSVRSFFGDLFGAIDFEGVGKTIRDTFGRVFGALGKIGSALGKLFGGTGGAGGAEVGSGLQKAFTALMNIIGGIADIIGAIVDDLTQTPLFETFKEVIDSVVRVFSGLVNIIKKIVAGPIGIWLVKSLSAAADLFITPFKLAIDAIDFVVTLIDGVIDIFTGDSEAGWAKVTDSTKRFLKAIVDYFLRIPKFLVEFFGGSWDKVKTAISDFVDGFIDAVKNFIGGFLSFFKSKSDEQKSEGAKVETGSKPTATSTPDPNIRNWAYSVYTGKAKEDQIPANIKGQVLALRDKPEQSWIDEVNKRQKENNAPKTETKTETKMVEPQKPAATPAIDLNNKDAVSVLKAIADYQRRTVDAVNNLNGNLYKRA